MPDTKFSFHALREHVRKYLWIYLAGIVACLFGSNLLWTTTRPQVPNKRNVVVFLADTYSNPAALDDVAADMLARTQAFDGTLQEVIFQGLQLSDPAADYSGSMLLVTRLAVGEGDIYLAHEGVLQSLITSGVLQPLDEAVAGGWLAEYELEPFYATLENEDGTEGETFLAALRIDKLTSLIERQAYNSQGAFLCVTNNGGNLETAMKAVEFMVEDLMEASHAATEDREPAA